MAQFTDRPSALGRGAVGLLVAAFAAALLAGCGGSASADDVADQVLTQSQAAFPDVDFEEATCENELKEAGDSTRCQLHGNAESLGGDFTLGTTVTVEERDGDSLILSIENDDEPVVEE